MADEELRAALFRFVDVVPACRSLDDLARHLAGLVKQVPQPPPSISAAMRLSGTRAGRAALGAAAAGGVRHLAHRFIVGESADGRRWRRSVAICGIDGVASSVDLLGEATVTQPEADRYAGPLPRRDRDTVLMHRQRPAGRNVRRSEADASRPTCRGPTCASRSRR